MLQGSLVCVSTPPTLCCPPTDQPTHPGTGNEGLEMYVSADPPVKLVLLDVTLPDMSGHQVGAMCGLVQCNEWLVQ